MRLALAFHSRMSIRSVYLTESAKHANRITSLLAHFRILRGHSFEKALRARFRVMLSVLFSSAPLFLILSSTLSIFTIGRTLFLVVINIKLRRVPLIEDSSG